MLGDAKKHFVHVTYLEKFCKWVVSGCQLHKGRSYFAVLICMNLVTTVQLNKTSFSTTCSNYIKYKLLLTAL